MAKTSQQPTEDEIRVGQAVKRLREERGWNQAELASAMRAEGYAWMPNTVSKVEQEVTAPQWRRVTGGELLALQRVFGVPGSAFGGIDGEDDAAVVKVLAQGEAVADGVRAVIGHIELVKSQAEKFRGALSSVPGEGRGSGRLGELSILASDAAIGALERARAEVSPLSVKAGKRRPDRIGVVLEVATEDGPRSIQFTSQIALDHFQQTGELIEGAKRLD